MVHSLNKGKSFERDIANMLTEKTGVKWHRVPQSGAFATNNKSNDSRFDGDVFTEHEKFKDIVIECKSNKNDVNLNALFSDKSLFWSWVEQAEHESKEKRWLLFVKITRVGIFAICSNITTYEMLGLPMMTLLKLKKSTVTTVRRLFIIKLK